jgi:protein gp37
MPDNVWLGVTVERPLFLSRADLLRKARGHWPQVHSAEPLLADLASALNLSGISQVIAGGESGLHLRDPARCAVAAWQTRRAANPMQLMEITENDRVVVRSSALESFGIKPRTKIAIVPVP